MAENKNSFVLYADLIYTVRKLSKLQAGELFLTILAYVNDENPVVTDTMVDLVFEPVKRQLKRDLVKWDDRRGFLSEAGKLGGKRSAEARRKQKEANEASASNASTNEANALSPKQGFVNEPVTVTVNVNDIDRLRQPKKEIEERMAEFKNRVEEHDSYPPLMLNEFFEYWSEKNHSGIKMKWEMEKTFDMERRLKRWAKNEEKFSPKREEISISNYGHERN